MISRLSMSKITWGVLKPIWLLHHTCAKKIWYAVNFFFDMFRLTLSLVGKWPVKIFNFRLGSQAAGKFPVGDKNFAQHWSSHVKHDLNYYYFSDKKQALQ